MVKNSVLAGICIFSLGFTIVESQASPTQPIPTINAANVAKAEANAKAAAKAEAARKAAVDAKAVVAAKAEAAAAAKVSAAAEAAAKTAVEAAATAKAEATAAVKAASEAEPSAKTAAEAAAAEKVIAADNAEAAAKTAAEAAAVEKVVAVDKAEVVVKAEAVAKVSAQVAAQAAAAEPMVTLSHSNPASVEIGGALNFSASGGTPPYTFSIESNNSMGANMNPLKGSDSVFKAGKTAGSATVRVTDSSKPIAKSDTVKVQVTLSSVRLESCRRGNDHAVYTSDLPSWRFGENPENAKGKYGGGLLNFLPNGEWSVGTAVLSETIRYDFAKKKAAVFGGAGVGASFRFYTDVESVDGTESLPLHKIKSECRASTAGNATAKTIASPLFSITPTVFASKPLKDQEFRVEPAIMLGFFQDLINVGAGFNLTGDDGDVGDVFFLFSLGFGFNFGGSLTSDQP